MKEPIKFDGKEYLQVDSGEISTIPNFEDFVNPNQFRFVGIKKKTETNDGCVTYLFDVINGYNIKEELKLTVKKEFSDTLENLPSMSPAPIIELKKREV